MDLKSLRADSASTVAALLDTFVPDAPRAELLETLDDLAIRFTIIAVANLLLDGESQKFFLNLCRASENSCRIQSLLLARGEALPSASKTLPLLAALVTGDFAMAAKVANLSRTTLNPDEDEYQDEFRWASTLRLLALGDTSGAAAAIAAMDADDDYADRVAVASALLARDAEAFEAAFVAAHQSHQLDVEERAQKFGTPVVTFAPHRFIWFEGLAFLRLAERAGVPTPPSALRYCPPLARVAFGGGYRGDWAVRTGAP